MAIVCHGCLGMEGQPLCYGYLGTEWLMNFMVAKRPFHSQFLNGRGTVICMGQRNGTVPIKQALNISWWLPWRRKKKIIGGIVLWSWWFRSNMNILSHALGQCSYKSCMYFVKISHKGLAYCCLKGMMKSFYNIFSFSLLSSQVFIFCIIIQQRYTILLLCTFSASCLLVKPQFNILPCFCPAVLVN